jgi:hypothetical protein
MPEFPIDADLAALSAALGGLAPAAPALNRDRLLYEAGRRSARSRPAWPIATVLFAALSAGLGARLATAPVPAPQIQIVDVSRPEAVHVRETIHTTNAPPTLVHSPAAPYLRLRDQVVRFGAESLPSVAPAAAAMVAPVEPLLGVPRGTVDDTHKARWQQPLFRGDV